MHEITLAQLSSQYVAYQFVTSKNNNLDLIGLY